MRLSLAKVESSIDLLKALSIEVEVPSHLQVSGEVLALGRSQNLTVYDASYFELARRERLPLATLDERLREAARRVGVAVLE
jgi:predicted nucleic acid-binding protein